MSQESGFSAHPPEKLKSAFPGQSSAFQTFSPNPCLVQQVPAIPSSISLLASSSGRPPRRSPLSYSSSYSVQTGMPASQTTDHMISQLPLSYYTQPHGRNLTTNCMAACCFLSQTSWLNPSWLLPHVCLFREADVALPSLWVAWLKLSHMASLFTTDQHSCYLHSLPSWKICLSASAHLQFKS